MDTSPPPARSASRWRLLDHPRLALAVSVTALLLSIVTPPRGSLSATPYAASDGPRANLSGAVIAFPWQRTLRAVTTPRDTREQYVQNPVDVDAFTWRLDGVGFKAYEEQEFCVYSVSDHTARQLDKIRSENRTGLLPQDAPELVS